MIGVIAEAEEEIAAREFFELFKTPWEFYRHGRHYDVVLCTTDTQPDQGAAPLVLIYGGRKTPFDAGTSFQIHFEHEGADLSWRGRRFPVYGRAITFRHRGATVLTETHSREAAGCVERVGRQTVARIGYDLFREMQMLLTAGQPAGNASIPTLDLHIALLRDLITACGMPLVEIPPVPYGHSFIACLTHDLDHASMRRHKLDATMLGFLYRATVGSALNASRGRLPVRKLFTNWAAAAKMPLVHLGMVKDPWYEFDRYVDIERGKPSTFFVIPFHNRPGKSPDGAAPAARASRYDISHIAAKIPRLISAGCEIGLHGIDAWTDSFRGREEAERITAVSKTAEIGVRMHWLYSNAESPEKLENAGFSYDSTVGYNETVGYRAGTGQAFKPFGANRILELPLHLMDTALFYPGHLNLSPAQAWQKVTPVLDNAASTGGAVTVNWHDRSIAPERLWGDFYVRLVEEMNSRGAWFGTASQAVAWFRKRRTAAFENGHGHDVKIRACGHDGLPGLRLRTYRAQKPLDPGAVNKEVTNEYVDTDVGNGAGIQSGN